MRPFPRSILRALVAGTAVLVLGGAAVGIAAAQAQPTPSGRAQSGYAKFVDALAKRLNITPDNLRTAITQARGDAGLPAGAGVPGAGFGFGGGGRRGFGLELNAAATAIGIPADQLRTELNGKSLAQVATAHGKTADAVATALKNAAHTRIDQAVTSSRLTADQATSQKTSVDQRIDQMVNTVIPQGAERGKRGPRPGASQPDWS